MKRKYTEEKGGERIDRAKKIAILLSDYQNLIFSLCYQMTQNYFEAEDLAQETFVAAYEPVSYTHLDVYKRQIVDVIDEETTEDMEKMAALLPSDEEYLKTPVTKLARNRIVWLCVLMISGTLSSAIISGYDAILSQAVQLAAFIPVLTGTGGNAGSQTSATIIRGMSLGDIRPRDILRVMGKEVQVGMICGVLLAALNFIKQTIFSPSTDIMVDLTVSVSMGFVVVVAKAMGCVLPLSLIHI